MPNDKTPHPPSFVGHPLPRGEGELPLIFPFPLPPGEGGERSEPGEGAVKHLFPELSNFYCHPGRAAGTPVGLGFQRSEIHAGRKNNRATLRKTAKD